LEKRLSMYKLRSKVEIVLAREIRPLAPNPDPRLRDFGSTISTYDAHRISLGVPEGGKDYAFGELFPHEAMFDQLNGVSFSKGCYVGQEVVSRMQHRGTARSRFLIVTGNGPLPPRGAEVNAGAALLGQMGSSIGAQGLALIRLDRLAEAYAAGQAVVAAGVRLTLGKPPHATFAVPSEPNHP